jgi:Uma2 family endonuclease
VSTSKTLLSAEELFSFPGDGLRHELVKGELRSIPPAGSEHGAIAARLGWRLAALAEEHDLGVVFGAETGFQLQADPDTNTALNSSGSSIRAPGRSPCPAAPKEYGCLRPTTS